MNRFVWALQILLGVFFFVMGLLHFLVPEGMPAQLGWMYDLPPWLHYISGTAELLGGLGLILPALTRIMPKLTPLAAAGLALVMIGAVTWHIGRGELRNVITNLLIAALLTLIAVVRWRIHPIAQRTTTQLSAPADLV